MFFKPKEIYQYKILEKYKIDIEETNRLHETGKTQARDYCKLIAKDGQYFFYGYKTHSDGSGGYVLRQEIRNPKHVVFFGESRKYNIVYKGFLFQVNENGEVGNFGITARNTENGSLIKYNWLSDRGIFVSINGFGRYYCQDTVKDVSIKDDKLVFKISRKKSKDPYNEYSPDKYDMDTQYDLIVENKGSNFVATRVFTGGAVSEKKQESTVDKKPASSITPVANNHKSSIALQKSSAQEKKPKYWLDNQGNVRCPGDACPENCGLDCPIYAQTIALQKLMRNDFSEAASLLRRAVATEPRFADAWNNLAACYGQMGDHKNAFAAYQRSYEITQKPNPLYGMAVATKNMKDYPLSKTYVDIYINKYGSDDRIKSLLAELSENELSKKIRESDQEEAEVPSRESEASIKEASKQSTAVDDASKKNTVSTGGERSGSIEDMRVFGKYMLLLLDEDTREAGYVAMEKIVDRFPEAGVTLGQYYQQTDVKRARKYFKMAADAGIEEGQWGYANTIPHSTVLDLSDPNDKEYLKYCLMAAEGGCPDAANEMGNICHRKKFYEESTYWYGMAYSLEHPSGMTSMRGITKEWQQNGVSKEYKPHMQHFTKERHETALLIYKMFNQSLETSDLDRMMELALQGENLAGFIFAKIMEQHNKDILAYTAYNALAIENHPYALRCYADMLLNGKGTARDVDGAFRMYQQAAERGNATAMFAMGQKAVKDGDKYLAACWFGQAYSRGMEMAGEWLEKLANK